MARHTRRAKRSAFSSKVSQLMHEGYKQRQALAIAFSEQRKGGTRRLRQSKARTRSGRA